MHIFEKQFHVLKLCFDMFNTSFIYNLILPVDRSAGECLVKGSMCAPLLTSVPPLDLSQEPVKKRYGVAAADRTPTLKSMTVSPNTKNWNRANLSHKQLCHSQA